MKGAYTKIVITAVALAVCLNGPVRAQEKPEAAQDKLSSEALDSEGKKLDQQIVNLYKKIEEVVVRYKLATNRDVRTLPYQVNYRLGNNYIEIERHVFEKNELLNKIIHLRRKTLRLYVSGQSISKAESLIFEKDYESDITNQVSMMDPSPVAAGTDDIVFAHSVNNKDLTGEKKFIEIRNTTAFPVRNDIKRNFLIPHLGYFYNVLLSIGETYAKSIKDTDSALSEFLKKSTDY
jgi:hypothetical protein